jgi:hypothetical protein
MVVAFVFRKRGMAEQFKAGEHSGLTLSTGSIYETTTTPWSGET